MDNTEAVLNEMEQKRQIEDALQLAENASRAKTVFLSNMSHDIRTPMNAIIGFTSLAKTYIDNTDRVRDYLEKISDSSMHLLSLVNDVLDMSRIESGRLHLDPTPCSLSDLMHNLRNILLPDIRERQLTFLMETENITDENVICDRLRLNQVLLNLIGNAMKFTPAGGSVTVELRELQGETENVPIYEFTVQDTGIGMSKAFVEHVFEAFERERNSTVSGIQGTGLGMSITKSIVDMMNGTISVQSVQGEGSTFTVRIPMQRVICENTENCSSQALHGIRALIVGEDSAACRSIASMLVQLGMEADFCVPEEAVRNIRMENGMHYGACLLDWRLPEQYEIETIRKIRHETEAPILLLSAYDFGDTEEAKKAGVTEFVPRPLFLSDLQRLLLNALYPEEENTPQPAIVRRIHGQRILLVEDNDLNREIAVEILRGAGFLVEEAENGSVAVEMIQKGGAGYYQLVLMDIQMPIMDGYTAAKTIRALEDKELSAIPIVAMTANAFAEDKQKAIAAGMNAHIAKPISVDNLLDTLEELLN
jgi:CheY-like chemotaxis protein/nitrogen-specific signal transduction histidine kinase